MPNDEPKTTTDRAGHVCSTAELGGHCQEIDDSRACALYADRKCFTTCLCYMGGQCVHPLLRKPQPPNTI